MFNESVYRENELRYPSHDLYVFMFVEEGKIQYFSQGLDGVVVFVESSEEALVFDGFETANRVFADLELEDKKVYITPLAAIQIMTGVCGGIAPKNMVIGE